MRHVKWFAYLALLVVAFTVGLVGTISASHRVSPVELLRAPAQGAVAPAPAPRPFTVEC